MLQTSYLSVIVQLYCSVMLFGSSGENFFFSPQSSEHWTMNFSTCYKQDEFFSPLFWCASASRQFFELLFVLTPRVIFKFVFNFILMKETVFVNFFRKREYKASNAAKIVSCRSWSSSNLSGSSAINFSLNLLQIFFHYYVEVSQLWMNFIYCKCYEKLHNLSSIASLIRPFTKELLIYKCTLVIHVSIS